MSDHQPVIGEAEAVNVRLLTKSGPVAGENPNVDEALDGSTLLDFYDANDVNVVNESTECKELIPVEQGPDVSSKVGPVRTSKIIAITPLHSDDECGDLEGALEKDRREDLTLSQDFENSGLKLMLNLFERTPKLLIHEDDGMVDALNDPLDLLADIKDLDLQDTTAKASCINSDAPMPGVGFISSLNHQHEDPVACDSDTVSHMKAQEASDLNGIQFEMVPVHIPDTDAPKCLLQTEIDSIFGSTHCEKEESSVSFEYNAKQEDFDVKQGDEFDIEMVGDAVEPVLNTVVTQSGHIVSTDFLEEMIEDAKNNKVIVAQTVLYGFLIYDRFREIPRQGYLDTH